MTLWYNGSSFPDTCYKTCCRWVLGKHSKIFLILTKVLHTLASMCSLCPWMERTYLPISNGQLSISISYLFWIGFNSCRNFSMVVISPSLSIPLCTMFLTEPSGSIKGCLSFCQRSSLGASPVPSCTSTVYTVWSTVLLSAGYGSIHVRYTIAS